MKALNTMNCTVMVDPASVPGDHNAFVCGSYDEAKQDVIELLESFGWPRPRIVDLGDIAAVARHGDVRDALAPPLRRRRRAAVQHHAQLVATSSRKSRSSCAPGSPQRPVCTSDGWMIVLDGATSQWKRCVASSRAIGPAVRVAGGDALDRRRGAAARRRGRGRARARPAARSSSCVRAAR